VSDENAAPSMFRNFTKRGSGIGGGIKPAPPPPGVVPTKPTLNTRKSSASGRAVLGDISNHVQKTKDEQLPKKKRVEEVEVFVDSVKEEDEVDPPSPRERHASFKEVDEKQEDVDMREEERSLELIADLRLDVDAGVSDFIIRLTFLFSGCEQSPMRARVHQRHYGPFV